VDLPLALLSILFAVIAAARISKAFRNETRRALTGVPETPIGAVKDGEKVRIKGRARGREPVRTSPLSQRPCIGFRVTVDSSEGDFGLWERVVEIETFDSFLLADDTGEAVLHTPFEIRLRAYAESSVDSASPALASLLEKEGMPASEVFVPERHFRYAETILSEGEEIVAVGRARIEIDPAGRAPSHRDPPVMVHMRADDAVVILANPADAG
jgi:hypothetical protein